MRADSVGRPSFRDRIPRPIEDQVEAEPDGELGFTRAVATPWRAGLRAASGLVLLAVAALVLAAALLVGPSELAGVACWLVIAAPVLSIVMGVTGRTDDAYSVAGPDGVAGRGGFRWRPALALRLDGSAPERSARLVLVRPDGDEVLVKGWTALRRERASGWDVRSVRWFAESIAELSGVELDDRLPGDEVWEAHEPSGDRSGDPLDLGEAEPVPPDVHWEHDRVSVFVPSGFVVVLIQDGTSRTREVPVVVTPTHIRVASTERAHGEILAIETRFGMRRRRNRSCRMGEIRAVLAAGEWVLVSRELTGVSAGVIVGAANAIRDAHLAARSGAPVARGHASDVPSEIRDLASKARDGE